jgi:hypothetical protein
MIVEANLNLSDVITMSEEFRLNNVECLGYDLFLGTYIQDFVLL